ncbi:MAG: copper chaperone PCu(A)C [Betaproteobacteria bacterium]|nr:copper chaperone PCu(A)C [Betaproteobacteria bacterium]
MAISWRTQRIVILTAILLQLAAAIAVADDALAVRDAWIRAAPPNAPVLAGYMTLENHSAAAKALVRATSPAFGAITLHRTQETRGIARMTHLPRLEIAPHAQLVFKPGGYHLMLAQPKRPLHAGDRIPVELEYADGTRAAAVFVVRREARDEPAHQH